MNLRNFFTAGICLTLFCLLAMPVGVLADEADQATKMTFSEPVEVPGHVLAAGTYWFTLMDRSADRNIVQIWNADRSHLVATIFAISDYRYRPTGKTAINFEERPADQPEAIEAWFYPGENFGHAFVYPKTRALILAVQTKKPVLSMPDETATDAVPPSSPAMNAVAPSGEQVKLSEIVESEMPSDNIEKRLPQTASFLPLFGLLGFAVLGSGIFLLRTQRKTA
jgi:uncharacterized surface anchored protein